MICPDCYKDHRVEELRAEVERLRLHGGECGTCDGWHSCCEAIERVCALLDDEPNWNGPEINSEVRFFANDIREALADGK